MEIVELPKKGSEGTKHVLDALEDIKEEVEKYGARSIAVTLYTGHKIVTNWFTDGEPYLMLGALDELKKEISSGIVRDREEWE